MTTIITLQVCDKTFKTYKDTLIRGSPYFQARFSGGFAEAKDGEGEEGKEPGHVFLDMDPQLFQLLLNRMRDPTYIFPMNVPGLRTAAEFLGIDMETDQEKQERLIPWAENASNFKRTVRKFDDVRENPDRPGEFSFLLTNMKQHTINNEKITFCFGGTVGVCGKGYTYYLQFTCQDKVPKASSIFTISMYDHRSDIGFWPIYMKHKFCQNDPVLAKFTVVTFKKLLEWLKYWCEENVPASS